MADIGSTVIYMGKQWNNQVRGTQPVWGVKKSNTDDEKTQNSLKTPKKKFKELLQIEWEKLGCNLDEVYLKLRLQQTFLTGRE